MKEKHGIWRAAALCAGIAGAACVLNKAIFSFAQAGKLLSDHEGQYFDWKFGRIYYEVSGEGSPLLLIHEMAEDGCGMEWEGLRQELAKHYRVYVPDLPGCGRSDKEKMIYTNYLYTAGINAFCEQVTGKRTDLVTSGISSTIAVMACHTRPELYGKLVLINPESFKHMAREQSMVEKILSKVMMLPLIGTSLYAFGYLLSCWKKRRMTQAVESTVRDFVITEEVRLEAAFRGGPAARFARASQIGHYTDIPFTFALKELNDPVCTIGGSNVPDISHTLEGYRYFCGDTQSYLLDCAEPHAERKEETAQIIDDFLSEAVL